MCVFRPFLPAAADATAEPRSGVRPGPAPAGSGIWGRAIGGGPALAGSSIAGPLMSLPRQRLQHRWPCVAAGTASRSHRCRWRAAGHSIGGPSMLSAAGVYRFCRVCRNCPGKPSGGSRAPTRDSPESSQGFFRNRPALAQKLISVEDSGGITPEYSTLSNSAAQGAGLLRWAPPAHGAGLPR
jgi:hypothetical protein